MKTTFNIIVLFAALFCGTVANAQVKDTVYVEVLSPAACIGAAATANNMVGCTEPVFKDGVLVTDRHAGWGIGVELLYMSNRYTSDDLCPEGDNTQAFGAAVTLSYDWCQKNWSVAPGFKVWGGAQTKRNYEGLTTGTTIFGGISPYLTIAPHSARLHVGPVLEFQNITYSNVNGDPHKIFAPFIGGEIGGEIKIGNRTRTGMTDVYGHTIQTKEKNPIYLTYSARCLWGKTSKKWDTSAAGCPNIRVTSIEVTIGVRGLLNLYKKH